MTIRPAVWGNRKAAVTTALLVALASLAFAAPVGAQWEYEDCMWGCMKCGGFFIVQYCTLVNQEPGACDCWTHCVGEFGERVCTCDVGGELCFGIIVEPVS